jgi:hypothetical protein
MRGSTFLNATLIASALVFVVLPAAAKENYHEKTFNADTQDKFQAVADGVRKEMQPGGRYEYVKPEERATIERSLGEMDALFAQGGGVATMKQDDKVKLFNAQEVVNSILTRRDSERVICKDEPKLGSHIRTTSCHTYGQEEEARRGTKNQLDEWKRLGCVNAGCAGSPAKRPTDSGGQ